MVYQLICFAFLNSAVMVSVVFQILTGKWQLMKLVIAPSPPWTNGSSWGLTLQEDTASIKCSQGPLEGPSFYTGMRLLLVWALLNPLWILTLMHTECSMTDRQQIYYWITAGFAAQISIAGAVYSLIKLYRNCTERKPETSEEIRRNTSMINRTLRNPSVTVLEKLIFVLDYGQTHNYYVPLFLDALFLAFAWRINLQELEQLANRTPGLQLCTLCDCQFTCGQKVVMFPGDHMTFETRVPFRHLLQNIERDPDLRMLNKLKSIRTSGPSIVEVIHPQPNPELQEILEEMQVVWLSTHHGEPHPAKPGLRYPNYKKSLTVFNFVHTDCFTKLGVAARTEADSFSNLVPMRYQSALSWAIRRLGGQGRNIPRFFGMLANPPFKGPIPIPEVQRRDPPAKKDPRKRWLRLGSAFSAELASS